MTNLVIKGTVYEPVGHDSYTVAYDLYMSEVLQSIGQVPAEDLLSKVALSGKVGDLLAGVLKPVNQPWTPEGAQRLARVLEAITDKDLKQTLMQVLVTGLDRFFGPGLTSFGTSRRSLAPLRQQLGLLNSH